MKTWDSGGQWEDRPMEDVLVESMEPTSHVEGGDKDTVQSTQAGLTTTDTGNLSVETAYAPPPLPT